MCYHAARSSPRNAEERLARVAPITCLIDIITSTATSKLGDAPVADPRSDFVELILKWPKPSIDPAICRLDRGQKEDDNRKRIFRSARVSVNPDIPSFSSGGSAPCKKRWQRIASVIQGRR